VFLCPLTGNPAVATPAPPPINYFESRQGYYTQYKKRQRLLAKGPKDEPDGPTYQAAVKKFAEIMHLAEADKAEDGNLVCTILELYAKHLKNQGRARTLEMVMRCLQSGNEEFGSLAYEELKLYHVQTWLDKMGTERGRSRGNLTEIDGQLTKDLPTLLNGIAAANPQPLKLADFVIEALRAEYTTTAKAGVSIMVCQGLKMLIRRGVLKRDREAQGYVFAGGEPLSTP
jgi:hypothetical protein